MKVFGPDLKSIDRACKQIESALKPVNRARDFVAAPILGERYVDIDPSPAARYGVSVEDIQNEIEVAFAGRAVIDTVEKRDRFPVRIRYVRSERRDEESIRRLLVSPCAMGASPLMAAAATTSGLPAIGTRRPALDPDNDAHHPRRHTLAAAGLCCPSPSWPTCGSLKDRP